jgi:hypothetical protein
VVVEHRFNHKWKARERTVNKSAQLQNLPEIRLHLTELASDRRLHAQSVRKHADTMPSMQRLKHTSGVFCSEYIGIFLIFCYGRWLS